VATADKTITLVTSTTFYATSTALPTATLDTAMGNGIAVRATPFAASGEIINSSAFYECSFDSCSSNRGWRGLVALKRVQKKDNELVTGEDKDGRD